MSQVSITEVAAGKLVNLLANDVARFDMAFMFLHYIWLVPVQLAVVMYFLYEAGGYAPFVGLFSVMLLILPIQGKYYCFFFRMKASKSRKWYFQDDPTYLNLNFIYFHYFNYY